MCWKCGRTGHYANSCKVVKKINQIEDEKLKHSLLNILINSDRDESDNSIEYNSELELEQIEYKSSSEDSKEKSE